MIPIETRLKRFPPIVCRLLARKGKGAAGRGLKPMTDEDIAANSGLTVAEVRSISWNTSWDKLDCRTMLAFSKACGINISSRESMHKHSRYIRNRHRFLYLKRDPQYETLWKPMIATYTDYLRSATS